MSTVKNFRNIEYIPSSKLDNSKLELFSNKLYSKENKNINTLFSILKEYKNDEDVLNNRSLIIRLIKFTHSSEYSLYRDLIINEPYLIQKIWNFIIDDIGFNINVQDIYDKDAKVYLSNAFEAIHFINKHIEIDFNFFIRKGLIINSLLPNHYNLIEVEQLSYPFIKIVLETYEELNLNYNNIYFDLLEYLSYYLNIPDINFNFIIRDLLILKKYGLINKDNINQTNSNGRNLISLFINESKIASFLLLNGADPYQIDNIGYNSIDYLNMSNNNISINLSTLLSLSK